MNLSKYETLAAVVELGSLTLAARQLNVTQSAVSHTLDSLERELGFPILRRSRAGVRLTDEGERLMPAVRALLSSAEQLDQTASSIRGLDTGLVRIGAFTSVAVHWLPGVLKEFQTDFPKVEFKLLKEEPRDGYRLRTYEFYPEPKLAVRMMMLVPDAAAEGKAKVPAMVSLPGSGASLESLAGEPDEYVCHFPARNRQSWFFAKMGIVGVALENPATAHNSVEGVSHFVCQAQFARLMTLAGRSNWGVVTTHVLETVAFLRSLPFIDAKRVGVAGMSLGCIPALYSAVIDEDIAAVVYNDFVSSWAANATSVTKRLGGSVDARRPYGFHKWFDDEPDLMAAVAPRPMMQPLYRSSLRMAPTTASRWKTPPPRTTAWRASATSPARRSSRVS